MIVTVRDALKTAFIAGGYSYLEGYLYSINNNHDWDYPLMLFKIPNSEQQDYRDGYAEHLVELILLDQLPQDLQIEVTPKSQDYLITKYNQFDVDFYDIVDDFFNTEYDNQVTMYPNGKITIERLEGFMNNDRLLGTKYKFNIYAQWFCTQ